MRPAQVRRSIRRPTRAFRFSPPAALLLGLLLMGCGSGDEAIHLPEEVIGAAEAMSVDQIRADVDHLASDKLMGRRTPSPGFDSAAAYVARRLETVGLRPFGDDGSFFQYYDVYEQAADTAAAHLEIGGERFRFGEDFVIRSFAGPLEGSYEVVYVGHGWTIPDEDIDPYEGVDVRGKLLLAHGPEHHPRNVEIVRQGRITVGSASPFEEGSRRGAVGILLVAEPEALEGWEESRGRNVARTELEPPVPNAYAALPLSALLLSPRAAQALLEGEGVESGGGDVIGHAEAGDYLPSFELSQPVTVHLPRTSFVHHRPYNVVALLEGSDPELRHEYITIASHLDGWIGREVIDGDSIYNSADDNASGSAGNRVIAEAMTRAPRPRRSLVFIWDSGEERGLWGTRHFVHNPPIPLDRIVTHVNIDMIGSTRAPGTPDSATASVTGPNEVYLVGPRTLSGQVDSILHRINRGYLGMELNQSRDHPESGAIYPRTDHAPFIERGVLTIGFMTGTHDRYHRPTDRPELVDEEKVHRISRMIFAGVWALADSEERPRIDRPMPPMIPQYR